MTAHNPATIESVRKLLTTPSAGTLPEDPKPTALTGPQADMLNQLIAHFSSPGFRPQEKTLDSKGREKLKAGGPLTSWEVCSQLNREALVRCLRADKWELAKCKARLEDTIVWRRSLSGDGIDIEEQALIIRNEAQCGKMFTLGFDKVGRPIVHMRPRHQSTGPSGNRFPLAFWLIDRAIDLMPPGVESILLVIDLSGPQESPSAKQQKEFVRTLGAHYCERLGQALVVNMPTIFVWVLKLLKPLIDPVTFAKAVVDKADPLVFAPAEQLDSPAGGSNGYDFDIATYWPALTSECTRRRYARLDEWVKMGKTVGSSELKDPSQTYRSSSSASQSSASTSLAPSTAGTSAHPDSVCTHDTSAREPIPQALVAVSQ
ncbi:hypothetical protein MJO28_008465 [Puccinia striiformis f. sp. tritici]|nr:hypothetical protein Pst134EA_015470 [Puccinia striiformis f. sp. tritici]KNE98275.1 hypothetical protein PSTG_08549 [Puccinia striiformis f. sp. tritici PST-78]POW21198.1 hypothetical protein PSHT_02667 [Puccinia striiformis]KAH9452631.1 hypothetical protein Pst134EB_016586 [Puccinia striiformis f. sp. tritici]KAH9463383.1 hypothetical protein Pst134EA_015470 [Puccinia striiformis f. sp. tritici]KAI7949644.1 hypothetical protein MJO28_008465 [Puccinia striiformis f. sp. tritici]